MSENLTHPESIRLADEVTAQCLGADFNDLESILARFQSIEKRRDGMEALGAVIQRLCSNYNRLLPIDALPDELLLHLFTLAMVKSSTFHDCRSSDDFRQRIKSYYTALYQLQAVCRRWRRIVVSYGPFWSIFDSGMEERQIQLWLPRSGDSLLTIGAFKHSPAVANRFVERMAPLSRRFSTLIIDLVDPQAGHASELWMEPAPNLKLLSIRGADGNWFSTPEGCFGGVIPSLRWLCVDSGVIPSARVLYQQLEDLTIQNPTESLMIQELESVLRAASRLQVLKLGAILNLVGAPTNAGYDGQIILPSLRLLSIEVADSYVISRLLSFFRLSSQTSVRIVCGDFDLYGCEKYIREHTRAVLHSMKETSFCLEMSPTTYSFQTRSVSIHLQVLLQSNRRLWPKFFANFSPIDGQGPIRVYLFLKTGASDYPTVISYDNLPDSRSIVGLQNDFFFLM
ncbi:hypothetical protein FRC04_002429 [Tulasnella sp. 424]|nr:hypothetical protein FRC04_002429 [Tulasnella sp. 424]KAG8967373.1 hypothetical protein FRC05_002083 [Tulasnella sp. 425]